MDAEKIRNLTDAELEHQQRDLNDQLFRLKFQLKMGQTESLKKIRGLRKDVARIKTIIRQKELAASGHAGGNGRPATAAVVTETASVVATSKPKTATPKSKSASVKRSGAKTATAKTRKK
jgi:large subunit ribosomal protein L29